MNRIYRIVFNRSLGLRQVVSELARSRGKGGTKIRRLALSISAALEALRQPASTIAPVPAPRKPASPRRPFAQAASLILPAAMSLGVTLPVTAHADTTHEVNPLPHTGAYLAAYGYGVGPFDVGAGVTISTSGGPAIYGSIYQFTLTNNGAISASGSFAIDFRDGGTITNNAGGVITSDAGGIYMLGGTGQSITNSGDISANGNFASGIRLGSGGTVTNCATGNISGTSAGVSAYNSQATVTNRGTISGTGTNGYGIKLQAGGSVTNSGTITGANTGIFINVLAGTIINSGSIVGGVYGVYMRAGGTLTNQLDGSITGGSTGVKGSGLDITNNGNISATSAGGIGIDLQGGGSVTNTVTSAISGVLSGIRGTGAPINISNTNGGLILGSDLSHGTGIDLQAGGNVTNDQFSRIVGVYAGVLGGSAAPVTITNDGVISSVSTLVNNVVDAAIHLSGGGIIANDATGRLSGDDYGVLLDTAASVTNDGSITANRGVGVYSRGGGTVINDASGVINGYTAGVQLGGSGSITNAGVIQSAGTAANSAAIHLLGGSSISNAVTGSLTGIHYGVLMETAASVTNDGSITGNRSVGVYSRGGGTVINDIGGVINGYTAGVQLASSGSVTNAGVIKSTGTAVNSAAVHLSGGGSVANAGILIGGLYGVLLDTAASVTNGGSITANRGVGVYSHGGGTVTNQAGGIITGTTAGVWLKSSGSVTNESIITTTGTIFNPVVNAAVQLSGGGSIANDATGSLSGDDYGVLMDIAASVTNDGSIAANRGVGVYSRAGGTVINHVGGAINGYIAGVQLTGSGSITNAGVIQSTGTAVNAAAVHLSGGGSISNAVTGSLMGIRYGVLMDIAASVTNDGSITASGGIGVYSGGGGTVTNHAGGVIQGGVNGVTSAGSLLDITNNGQIAATRTAVAGTNAGTGIYLEAGGSVTNTNSATISGTGNGIGTVGAPVSVINSNGSTISGNDALSGIGVLMYAGGSVTNDSSSTINGGYAGVRVNGGSGTIANTGTIQGFAAGGVGVRIDAGGLLTNNAGGIVTGGKFGAYLGAAGTVTNSGSISGTGALGTGVQLLAGGVVGNDASGNISGTYAGVSVSGTSTVTNGGSITGGSFGVYSGAGGTLTNQAGGFIKGGSAGVHASNVLFDVVNNGTLVSANGFGIYLQRGGSVTNAGTATISGANGGVVIDNVPGSVTNSGGSTISGNDTSVGIGVYLRAGGSVTNDGSSTIEGGYAGVRIDGSGTITNAGTISSAKSSIVFSNSDNLLTLQTGSSLVGTAIAVGIDNQLQLDGNGESSNDFSGFGIVSATAGTQWVLSNAVAVTSNLSITTDTGSQLTLSGNVNSQGLTKQGDGTLVIDGTATNTGNAEVMAGRLIVGSDTAHTSAVLQGNVQVDSGATIGGHGELGGNLNVLGGGHLAPGNSIGTLTVGGDLTLAQGSQLDFEFGAPGPNLGLGASDSVAVQGNLSIDQATLNIADAENMRPGLYNLFTYDGTLTEADGGIVLGGAPAGTLTIQNLTASNQINLINSTGLTLTFWNANGQAGPNQMGGGSGTWSATAPAWTDSVGSLTGPMAPQPGFAIFGGAAGTVMVNNGGGAVSALGLQFASGGYALNGDILTLVGSNGAAPVIAVGDGSAASASWIATIGNVIAGSSGIEKTDPGTLVLTGNNTYTGGSTIGGGTLSVSSDANLGDASGAVTLDGGTLMVTGTTYQTSARDFVLGSAGGGLGIADAGNTFTVTQSITGTGSLTKSGDGTLVLAADNGFTGQTTIEAGTLALSAGASIAASSGVLDNGTFDISATSGTSIATLSGTGNVVLGGQTLTLSNGSSTFDGVIGGTGGLNIGGGVVALSGANTYTGATRIDAGTLALQGAGSIAATSGVVANGTFDISGTSAGASVATLSGSGQVALGSRTLALTQAADTFAGTISGSGGLVIAGNESLTGNSTYSGGTQLASGSLALGNASAIGSGTLAMANGTSIAFASSFTLANAVTLSGDPTVNVATGITTELSGAIADGSSAGDLVKTGGGTLLLSGTNTYTGATEVAAGTLDLEGSVTSTITVDNGAALIGSGSVGGLHATAGATITPGSDAIGTLAVKGNVVFEAGSTYQVNLTDTGSSDLIHATGTAVLHGGSVIGLAAGTNWDAGAKYTVLTADGGVTGSFGSVTSNFAFLTPTLTYDADNAYLTLARNDEGFASFGITQNERATAAAIEALGNGATVYKRIVTLDAGQATAAFNNLAGASLASNRTAIVDDSRYVRDAIGNHLQGIDDNSQSDDTGSVWTSTWGHWGSNKGDANTGSQNGNGSGLLVGADRDLGNTRLGAVIAHSQLSSNSEGDSAHGTADHIGLYAATELGAWQLQGGAAHSWYQTSSQRAIVVPGLTGHANADYNSGVTQAYVDGGYRFGFTQGSLTPFVNLAHVWDHEGGIHEHGSAADLDVQANSNGVNYGTAGLRGSYTPTKGIELHASLGYQHAWGDLASTDTQRIAGGVDSFTVDGVPVAKHAAIADVGLRFDLRRNLSVDATYHGQFGGQAKDQSARLALTMSF